MTSSSATASHASRLAAFCRRASLLGAVLLLALPPMAGQAQTLVQQGAEADPPSQVARLNLAEGEVSFSSADAAPAANAWTLAELNRPLTQGDRLWTGPGARAELHAGSTALRMNAQTSLDFLQLDDHATRLSLPQGTLQLRVRALFEGQRLEVDTPNLAFVVSQPGDYRLDVNPSADSTRVVALSGAGTLYGGNGQALALAGGQQATFTGTQLTPGTPGASVQDNFDTWAADRDRREDQSVAARYVPRDTIGYQQLDSYGDWNQDPTYGAVWLPRALPAAWAPYSAGHWNWIAPWGWTWVDDAPWGFAPFHYGRWARIGPRWAWVPGRLAPRPVYAPALVAFVGGAGPGVNWNITVGGQPRPGIGWFPLAPGEAYRPAYRASPRYLTRVNNNITVNINTAPSAPVYRYQRQAGAVTAASRDDFMRGRPVRGDRPDARELASAQPLAPRSALPPRPDRPFFRPPPGADAAPPPALVSRPVIGSRPARNAEGRIDRPGGNPARPDAARPPQQMQDNDVVRQQRQAQQMQAAQQRQAEMEQQRQIRAQDPTRPRPGTPAARDQQDAQRPEQEQARQIQRAQQEQHRLIGEQQQAQQQQRAQMDQQRQIREQDQARQAQAQQAQRAQQDQQRLMREQQQAQQAQAQQQQRAQMDQQRQIQQQDQARQAQARQVQRDQQEQHRLIREQQQAQQAQAQQQQRAQMDQQRQIREQDQARQAQARQASRAQQPQGEAGERPQGQRGQPRGEGDGRRQRPGGPPAQEP